MALPGRVPEHYAASLRPGFQTSRKTCCSFPQEFARSRAQRALTHAKGSSREVARPGTNMVKIGTPRTRQQFWRRLAAKRSGMTKRRGVSVQLRGEPGSEMLRQVNQAEPSPSGKLGLGAGLAQGKFLAAHTNTVFRSPQFTAGNPPRPRQNERSNAHRQS